jgi:hypothetical protein
MLSGPPWEVASMGGLLGIFGGSTSTVGLISDFVTTDWIIVVVGLTVLIIIAVCIGVSMDTDAQHRAAQEAAEQTRQCNEACQKLDNLRRRVRAEQQQLAKQHAALEKCVRCPYRTAGG